MGESLCRSPVDFNFNRAPVLLSCASEGPGLLSERTGGAL